MFNSFLFDPFSAFDDGLSPPEVDVGRRHVAEAFVVVAWKEEGFDGTRLSHIAARLGFFYDAHRAVEDCYAGIEVLSRTLPVTGALAMAQLLNNARKPTKRIWAVGSPFDSKDVLKARGYRWNDGSDGRNKAWYFDVGFEAYDAEYSFLKKEIYQSEINLPVSTITALERFSGRA